MFDARDSGPQRPSVNK